MPELTIVAGVTGGGKTRFIANERKRRGNYETSRVYEEPTPPHAIRSAFANGFDVYLVISVPEDTRVRLVQPQLGEES
jgi:hypothetical protein